MRSITKLAVATAIGLYAPHFVAAQTLSVEEMGARAAKARALTNEFINSFTYEIELKGLRVSKGWFDIFNSATVTVKLEAGHMDGFNKFIVDMTESKEVEIRKNQIDTLSQPIVMKVPAERLFVREAYSKPKIYLRISVTQDGKEIFLAGPVIQLDASNLQRHRHYMLGTDYIRGTDYKNIPTAFPMLIRTGEAEPRTALIEKGADSAVLIVHRRPIDIEKQKVLASQFHLGERAFVPGYPEFRVSALKPEAGVVIGRGRDNYPMIAELAHAHPVKSVQSLNGISVGDCVVGYSGARETVAEISAPGFLSVWTIIGGTSEKQSSAFVDLSEVKIADCNGEDPKAAENKEDDDD